MLKFLTYYAQYYAHVKDVLKNLAVLLEYIHLYHNFNVVTVLLAISTHYITSAQIIITVDVLLEYIDLQSYFQSSTTYYAGIMLGSFSYTYYAQNYAGIIVVPRQQ